MTSFEMASIILSCFASILSLVVFFYTIIINKRNKEHQIYEKFYKYLVSLIESKFPQICDQYVVISGGEILINDKNLEKVMDLIRNIREKFYSYKEALKTKDLSSAKNRINNFEDACLELKNVKSEVHIDKYKSSYSELKKFISKFVKEH